MCVTYYRNGSVIVGFLVLLKPTEKLHASLGISQVTLGPYEAAFAFLETSLSDLNVTGDMAGTLHKVNILKLHLFIGKINYVKSHQVTVSLHTQIKSLPA